MIPEDQCPTCNHNLGKQAFKQTQAVDFDHLIHGRKGNPNVQCWLLGAP